MASLIRATQTNRGVSERLRGFIEESPYQRRSLIEFMRHAAEQTAVGARVGDVAAEARAYAELFAHAQYRAVQWDEGHAEVASLLDIGGSNGSSPASDERFDVVLLVDVMGRIADPAAVLHRAHAALEPGGAIYLTVPLMAELTRHERDCFRFTPETVQHLLETCGFEDVSTSPNGDVFTTIAQLLLDARSAMGGADDGLNQRRQAAADALEELAGIIADLAPLDVRHALPLGYNVEARRSSTRMVPGRVSSSPSGRS